MLVYRSSAEMSTNTYAHVLPALSLNCPSVKVLLWCIMSYKMHHNSKIHIILPIKLCSDRTLSQPMTVERDESTNQTPAAEIREWCAPWNSRPPGLRPNFCYNSYKARRSRQLLIREKKNRSTSYAVKMCHNFSRYLDQNTAVMVPSSPSTDSYTWSLWNTSDSSL